MNTHLTPSSITWKSSMYPFCVFFIVEVKVHASSLWLIAVSKGLNTPDLTFDPGVCEKSKSKVRPKKKYARIELVARAVLLQEFSDFLPSY